MKKHLLLIALVGTIVLAACNKNNNENQGEAVFTATTEHQGGRTSLDPNNGNINWTAGDQIVIANDNDETAVFTLQSGEGTTEGGFGTSDEFNTIGPFIAAYPETATIANDVVTFNLPATQAMGETGTFANGANPMVACSDDKNLSFKNLCGGVGVRLKGNGVHVSAVRITSKNTSEKLWGTYEVSNCAAEEPTLTEASGNQGSNVITLTCDVTLTTAAKTFFVMLPPGTLANGFTMEVLDGDEVLLTKETTSDVAFVERNSVKCFNEILVDVEFDGNVEIPSGMSNTDIIVTNYIIDAIPDENGDFAIGYSKMLMATNATNGEIIYMSMLSVDDDINKDQKQLQDYELSTKETAITLALNILPYGLLQSKDETFASIKSVLYSLGCVQNLKAAIESVVAQYGYLKMDELSLQIIAVRDFFMNELFPESKGNGDGEIPVVGTIELAKDGTARLESPSLPVSRYRGIRVDLESANYNESNNTWSLNLTAYSDNGIYVGVNKGYIAANGQAHVSNEEKTHYFIPPMNAGKFVGTFVSWSGLKDYFNDTKRLFTEEGFSFDDMTWDKAKLENIRIDIGVSDNALTMLSPWDDTRTAIVNAVYTVLGGINCWVTTDGILDYFMDLFMDDDFVLLFINNWNHGVEGFTVVAERICEKFEDFLFEQSLSIPANSAQIPEKLKGKVETIQKAVTKLISMINFGAFAVGTAASFNLFEGFALEIDAEFNEPLLPSVSTQSYELLSSTQAVVVAKLESIGTISVTEVGVCYSPTSIVPTVNDLCVSHPSPTMVGSYPCQLNGLQANKTYHARAYAKCPPDVVVYADEVVSFNTGNQPTVTTHEVLPDNIGSTWATVTGSVVFPDSTQPTEYERGFVLGESEFGLTVNSENMVKPFEGTTLLNYSCTFTDLWPETPYYVRAYSYSPNGQVVYANEVVSFTTLSNSGTQTFTITTTSNPTDGGTVTGNGTYDQGQSCTVTATANSGYTFNNWTENGNAVSTDAIYTFTVSGNRTLVANFTANGGGGGNGSYNGHEYVDLGLPSGTLWATCNVGADTPEGYGNYFAWGETQPKTNYDWSTYQYCNGSENTLTKYCNNAEYGYNGFTDNLTTLLPEDDAATANWGSGWRMPTQEEWQELLDNTTVTWTQQNGVNGRLFTASNGNSLFLPAAGYRDYSSLYDAGSYGSYWSSSLYTSRPHYAWGLRFSSDYIYMSSGYCRYYGPSVRAVRSLQN